LGFSGRFPAVVERLKLLKAKSIRGRMGQDAVGSSGLAAIFDNMKEHQQTFEGFAIELINFWPRR
jgi:hypothetical protein